MIRIFFSLLILFFSSPLEAEAQGKRAIEINQGRQLMAYTPLAEVRGLQRRFHSPRYVAGNPVLKAELPWEFNAHGDPYAAPFSGGVWFDETAGKFKMWYSAGGKRRYGLVTCYAESADGRQWTKPSLDVVEGTNIVDSTEHDCVSVLLDKHETDAAKRYKMFIMAYNTPSSVSMMLKYSADGIHWSAPKALSGELYDRCAAYYDPFRGEYVLSLKTIDGKVYQRARCKLAGKAPELAVSLAHRVYRKGDDKYIRYWFHADDDDPRHPQFPSIRPQIYNHEAMPYEASLLGYFTVWQGPENDACDSLGIQKRNEVLIAWSEDGFQWNRECKKPFLPVSEDFHAWNAGNVQSVGGCPVIVGDSLYFYVSARFNSRPLHPSNFSTGLATLRRDGFVSMDAGKHEGYLLTEPVCFDGKYLFVNADVRGALRVEVLDADGNVIDGYSGKDCVAMRRANSTKRMITWRGADNLAPLAGKPVRLKFYMSQGQLYSFWVSPWKTGESRGYTAGGGPGLHHSGTDVPN